MRPPGVTISRILVDTDVVSYLFGNKPEADFFREYLLNRTLAVSFMTVAELYFGAYKRGWGSRRIGELENYLKNYVVVPYDYLVCQRWARVRADRRRMGLPIGVADTWHAACALVHACALATNDTRDFLEIPGLELIAPPSRLLKKWLLVGKNTHFHI
jgi:tRNA(fMet)-specific endonuclease VapC